MVWGMTFGAKLYLGEFQHCSVLSKFQVPMISWKSYFRLQHVFATFCGFYGAACWPTVTDGRTSRKRGRVQPRAGGREAETYPAFGGALAHPPELQCKFVQRIPVFGIGLYAFWDSQNR